MPEQIILAAGAAGGITVAWQFFKVGRRFYQFVEMIEATALKTDKAVDLVIQELSVNGGREHVSRVDSRASLKDLMLDTRAYQRDILGQIRSNGEAAADRDTRIMEVVRGK